MDSRVAAVLIPPEYEDFEPSSELVQEKDCDTILLNLPGFRKDNMKVQLTTSKILRISGSRPIGDNKWKRFQKEIPVSPDHDTQKITAKFEGGILYVRLPKLIPPLVVKKEEKKDTTPPASNPSPLPTQKPAAMPMAPPLPPQKRSVEQQFTKNPAVQDDSNKQTNAQIEKEEQKVAEEKIVEPIVPEMKEKIPSEEKAAAVIDNEEKSTAGDKREDEKANNPPEEETRDIDENKEKSIGRGKGEDEAKDGDKREKECTETADGSGKTSIEKYKERAADVASILKKHRTILGVTLVVIFAFVLGLHITNFVRSLKRNEI